MAVLTNILNLFIAPGVTFEAIKERNQWKDSFTPLVIMALAGVLNLTIMKDLYIDVQFEQAVNRIEDSSHIPEDQKDETILKMQDRFENPTVLSQIIMWSSNFLRFPVRIFTMTLIVLLIGNFIFGGEMKYGSLLTMTAYSYLISILELAVKIPLMLSKLSVEVFTGLGLLGIGERGSFIYNFIAGLDLFSFWRIVLLAIGMGILYNKETKTFLWALIGFWLVQLAVYAGLGAIIR